VVFRAFALNLVFGGDPNPDADGFAFGHYRYLLRRCQRAVI
jgi:hypothetical protein